MGIFLFSELMPIRVNEIGFAFIFAKFFFVGGGIFPPCPVSEGSAILKLLQVYVGAVVIFYHARQSFRSSCTAGDRLQWVENISV